MYISFTDEQKEQARNTDIAFLLECQGEKLKRSGSEQVWLYGGQKVTIRGNVWYHQYEQVGGDAIDFVRKFYGKEYPEAVEYLLGNGGGYLAPAQSSCYSKDRKTITMPEKNENMRRAFAYLLSTRGLNPEIVYAFADAGLIYESLPYHNVVFVGRDREHNPRHANVRSTSKYASYKGNATGSEPEYSFHWQGKSDRLYVFEAPIDMLSYISMHPERWRYHSYAACCGVGDRVVMHMLDENPYIHKVYLCLDNDIHGQEATERMKEKLSDRGIETEILVPVHKDWNEDLLHSDESEEETVCPALQL